MTLEKWVKVLKQPIKWLLCTTFVGMIPYVAPILLTVYYKRETVRWSIYYADYSLIMFSIGINMWLHRLEVTGSDEKILKIVQEISIIIAIFSLAYYYFDRYKLLNEEVSAVVLGDGPLGVVFIKGISLMWIVCMLVIFIVDSKSQYKVIQHDN